MISYLVLPISISGSTLSGLPKFVKIVDSARSMFYLDNIKAILFLFL